MRVQRWMNEFAAFMRVSDWFESVIMSSSIGMGTSYLDLVMVGLMPWAKLDLRF